jgi:tripartite-type tricarboxylate transporter receptor subunit TctC
LATVSLSAAASWAQDYPSRPITLIIPYTAGGGTDIIGRAFAESMGKTLGQTVVVLNEDGASNTAGMASMVKAPADGYTMAFTPLTPITQAPYTMKGLPYKFESFGYVCWIYDSLFALAVRSDSPHQTFEDLKKAASSGGKPLSYGFAGMGSVPHVQMADAAKSLGLKLTAVPFRGAAPATTAVLSGEIDFANISIGSAANQKVRLLAVFSDARHPTYPDVPTAAEAGIPDPIPSANVGIYVRADTPESVRAKLESACRAAVENERVKKLAETSQTALFFKPGSEFARQSATVYKRMGEILANLGLAK